MLRLRFAPFALASVMAALALAGCATTGGVSDTDEEVSASQEAASEARQGPDGPGFRHGPPRGHELLFVALHDLDLSAEQRKTLEGALAELGEKDRSHMQAVGKVLATGVRAGKVDEAAVKAKIDELGPQDHRAKIAKALNTLHATLSAEQRAELVAKVEEMAERHRPHGEGRGPRPDGKGPDGQGPEGHPRGPHGPGMGMGHHGPGMGPMGFLLHDLNLSDAQREKIHAALEASRPDKPSEEEMAKKHEEMRARQKAVLDAFKGASFDAAQALPEKPQHEPPALHLVKALNIVVPELDATQREALAVRLEQGPPEPKDGHRGPHRDGKGPGQGQQGR